MQLPDGDQRYKTTDKTFDEKLIGAMPRSKINPYKITSLVRLFFVSEAKIWPNIALSVEPTINDSLKLLSLWGMKSNKFKTTFDQCPLGRKGKSRVRI